MVYIWDFRFPKSMYRKERVGTRCIKMDDIANYHHRTYLNSGIFAFGMFEIWLLCSCSFLQEPSYGYSLLVFI